MGAAEHEPASLASVLQQFHERAAIAEERLNKLEASLRTNEDGPKTESVKNNQGHLHAALLELRDKLEVVKKEQEIEREKAKLEQDKLLAENERLKYRIKHLVRAVEESDKKLAAC